MLKRLLCALSLALSASAATISVTARSTETQIIIAYTATTASACTVTLTDNNGGPSVHDVDPTLFTSANQDLSRTAANGYRWPTIVSGLRRTVFMGGHDEVKHALDNKWYSTALQVASNHSGAVSCNGGADTGTFSISTQNEPLGSYYPELVIPDLSFRNEGSYPIPTIDYSPGGAATGYTDPIKGTLIKIVYHDQDLGVSYSDKAGIFTGSTALMDPPGAWTNPLNGVQTPSSFPPGTPAPTTWATTSVIGTPLFIPFAPDSTPITDYLVQLYAKGAAGTEIIGMCLTEDGGATCATPETTFTPTTSFACVTYSTTATNCEGFPNAVQGHGRFPTTNFSGWGGCPNAQCGPFDIQNSTDGTISNVSISGSVMLNNSANRPGFKAHRPAGFPYWLSGCSVGGPTQLVHVASDDSYTQVTLQEAGITASGCTLQEAGAGVRIVLKNTGTVNVAAYVWRDYQGSTTYGSDAARRFCNPLKTTATKDCDGVTRNVGVQLCAVIGTGIYALQDDGRACLMSNGNGLTGNSEYVTFPGNPWGTTATSLYGQGSQGNMYRLDLTSGTDFSAYVPSISSLQSSSGHGQEADKFTYTKLTGITTSSVTTQILASSYTLCKTALNSGLFTTNGINTVMDYSGGTAFEYLWVAGGQGALPMKAWVDASSGTLLSCTPHWGQPYGLNTSALHSIPWGIGGFSYTGVISTGSVGPVAYSTSANLGGPFVSYPTGIHDGTGSYHNYTIPQPTTITNASPAVMTWTTAPDLYDIAWQTGKIGVKISCSGFTGSWAALNGTLYLMDTDSLHFKIYSDRNITSPVDSTGFGAYTSQSPTCTTGPGIYDLKITSVSNSGVSGNAGSGFTRLTLAINSDKYPSGKIPVRDNDPLALSGLGFTTQYYAKKSCTGCASNQIDIYTNPDLAAAHALPYSTASGLASTFAIYAETCPDPATVPSSYTSFLDTGIGTPGNPKVRCVTYQLDGEPCSTWANTAANESTSYPCPWASGDTTKSMLTRWAVGDGIYNLRASGGNEGFEIVAVNWTNDSSPMYVTLERSYGDLSAPSQTLPCGFPNFATTGCNGFIGDENNGMILIQGVLNPQYMEDITTGIATPFRAGIGHTSMFPSVTSGHMTLMGEVQDGHFDTVYDQTAASVFASVQSFNHHDWPTWSGDTSRVLGTVQNYNNISQNPAIADPADMKWGLNWHGVLPLSGNDVNSEEGFQTRSFTKIAGTTYDLGSTTSIVWKIQPLGTVDQTTLKKFQLLVVNGAHVYLQDKSGPGSLITDADLNHWCAAYKAGECRPNSAIGDVFMAIKGQLEDGWCITSNVTRPAPCATVVPPVGGWGVQMRVSPLTLYNNGIRRLTSAFHPPMEHHDYSNWGVSADAKFALFPADNLFGHSKFAHRDSLGWFAAKLPPFPTGADTTNRMDYVKIPVAFSGSTGDQIRVMFWYGEYGAAGSQYCTTRNEACWTSNSATQANPFVFASETQAKTPCDSGCTVNIPAIPGRIVFWQEERSNGSRIAVGPVRAMPVH